MQKLLPVILFFVFFITPQGFANVSNEVSFSDARYQLGDQPEWKTNDFDDSKWIAIRIPQAIQFPKQNEPVLYWIRIHLSDLPKDLQDPAIALGKIGDADEVFFNGHFIGSTGDIQKQESSGYHLARLYRIPRDIYHETNSAVIAIRAKKDSILQAGIYSGPIGIDEYKNLEPKVIKDRFLISGLGVLLAFFSFMMGLYHLYLWVRLPTKKMNLWFFYFSLVSSLFILSLGWKFADWISNPTMVIKIHAFLGIGSASLFLAFLISNISQKISKTQQFLLIANLIFLPIIAISKTYHTVFSIFNVWYLIGISTIVYIGVVTFRLSRGVRRDLRALWIGTGVMLLTAFADVLFGLGFWPAFQVSAIGFFSLNLGIMVSLAHGFTGAYINVEDQVSQRTIDLRNAIEQLKGLEKLKEKFFSNISHDLKTPVTIIQGAISKLRDKFETEGSLLDPIESNTNKLSKMISNILLDTKLKEGRVELHPNSVQIRPFFDHLVSNYRILADREKIKWEYKNEATSQNAVFDPEYIERVVDNVVSNAIKYTKTTPRNEKVITFRVWTNQDHLLFSVEDSGIGIPKNEREKVFERFSQSSLTDLKVHGGFGIGLSFVKEMIEKHKGLVSIDESKWGGVLITCMIPLQSENAVNVPTYEMESIQNIQSATTTSNNSQISIPKHEYDRSNLLICEDNSEIAKMIVATFEDEYNIFYAENGQKGLNIVSQNRIDCILCDYVMPEMDGAEMLRLIKQDKVFSQIPFLFLTSQSDENLIETMIESGATDYITKPFVSGILKARVHRAIESVIQRNQIEKEKKYTTLGLMSAGISHELKNPIHAMMNYLNILQNKFGEFDESEPSQAHHQFKELKKSVIDPALGFLKQSTDRMSHLVENVNIFSTSSGQSQILNLKQAVGTCIQALSHKATQKGINITESIDPNLDIEVLPSIQQAIINILDNSIDAVDEKIGRVDVQWIDKGDFGILEIRDNGTGVPENIREHIFDMFMTTKITKRGSGFGLYITKNIIEFEHGGNVWVEDNTPKGAVFLCKLWKEIPRSDETNQNNRNFNISKSIQ